MPRRLETGLTILLLWCFLLFPGLLWASFPLFLIIERGNGEEVVSVPIQAGESFSIRYIHSVDESPVYEVFYADEKKGILIQETYFKMFGAGMGHWPGRGKIVGQNGWIFIKDMNIPIGEFYLRIGAPCVDHTILIKGQEIHLSRMIPGTRVRIYIKGAGN